MEYLLYLSGGDSGRTISLEKRGCHMISTRRAVGGKDVESSHYARECGTYEIEMVRGGNECSREFGIDVPKSIETESFPSSVGMA